VSLVRENWPGTAIAEKRLPCVMRGAMHSWAPIAIQDRGTALDLCDFRFEPAVDRERRRVTVPGSLPLAELYRVLAAHDLALAGVPMVTTATVAGAAATCTHGANREDGRFGEHIDEVHLVDARLRDIVIDAGGCWAVEGDGRRLLLGGVDPLRVARHHRGALGVVHAVGFACEPAFDLELVDAPAAEDEAFGPGAERLRSFYEASPFASAIWFVPQRRVLLRHAHRSTAPRRPRGWLKRVVLDELVRTEIASLALRMTRHRPWLAARLADLAARSFPAKAVLRDRWDVVQTYLPSHATHAVGLRLMEYGVKLDHLAPALDLLRAALRGFPMSMPIGMRRTGADFQIELMWQAGYPGAEQLAQRLERDLVDAFGADAMPHDAKLHWIDPWPRLPAEERSSFLEMRRLLDPDGVFSNDALRRSIEGS
jgi:FAD/FMN-containing dehydrogenase